MFLKRFISSFTLLQSALAIPTSLLASRQDEPSQFDLDAIGSNILCIAWSENQEIWGTYGCRYYSKIPDYNTKIFRWREGWPGGPHAWSALRHLDDGAKETFSLYSNLLDGLAEKVIRIRLVPDIDSEPNTYGKTIPSNDWKECYVRVRILEPSDTFANDQKHFLAHELYHCIQQYHKNYQVPGSVGETSQWWIDGGAEFFANVVFPRGYAPPLNPYGLIGEYKPGIEFWKQGYACAVFYLYLYNSGWSEQKIDQWLAQVPYTDGVVGPVVEFLSGNKEFTDAFPEFAKALFDSKIKHSNGAAVRPDYKAKFTVKEWSLPAEGSKKFPVESKPYAIEASTVSLPKGRNVRVKYIPDEGCKGLCVVNYRQVGTQSWSKLTETTIDVSCDDGKNKYEFLHSTTAISGSGAVEFTISENPTEEEACKKNNCIEGKWIIDNDSSRDFLQEKITEALEGFDITLTGLTLEGTGTYEFINNTQNKPTSTITFEDVKINYNLISTDAFVPSSHTNLIIDGSATGDVTDFKAKTYQWTNTQSDGVAKTTVTIDGIDPFSSDIPLGGSEAGAIKIEYQCGGNNLNLTAYYGGVYTWAYMFKRS
ncbi:hypothetical protein ABW19_dt0204796 [Dactylella cylindrospora]|nr:hypothetical protein ABW19_dt0204796 [Dactylella cylindrospora]